MLQTLKYIIVVGLAIMGISDIILGEKTDFDKNTSCIVASVVYCINGLGNGLTEVIHY